MSEFSKCFALSKEANEDMLFVNHVGSTMTQLLTGSPINVHTCCNQMISISHTKVIIVHSTGITVIVRLTSA